jgi:hypothetical protein
MQTMVPPTIILNKSKTSIYDVIPQPAMIKINKNTMPEELGTGVLWKSLFLGFPKIL